jgi:choline dehydrogenase-like flavoprotein
MPDNKEKRTYEAIVIGSGASGGWAAKELCDKGLSTLILERAVMSNILKIIPRHQKLLEFEFRGTVAIEKKDYKNARVLREQTLHWALKDDEQPFVQEKPFRWVRGYHMGGKSLMWARQTQRWSDFDFEGPIRDGFAVDWPIRYKDIEPWYSYVEKFAGIAGNKDGLPELPDSEVMPGFEMSCVEAYFKESLQANYPDRKLIQARCAHITDPQPIHVEQGEINVKTKICATGAVYMAVTSVLMHLPFLSVKIRKATIRPFSVVHSIIYDETKGKATGVRVIDGNTKK